MPSQKEENLLRDAIARNSANVLSLPSAGMLRHCKSRFLGETDGNLVLEAVPTETPLVNSLIASGEECLVTFKGGVNKSAFATRIVGLLPGWAVNDGTIADAMLLAYPAEVKTMQRRADYRATVPMEYGLRVRVWRISNHVYLRDTPPFAQEVLCDLRDLSVGGMGVRFFAKDGKPPKISTEDRLRIQITLGNTPFLLEGTMRHPKGEQSPESLRVGVAFKKLEHDLEGRRILAQLTRIVGDLQREELRQHRMGMAEAG